MKVKIFSVKIKGELHEDWKPCIIDELTEKLEVEKGDRNFPVMNI